MNLVFKIKSDLNSGTLYSPLYNFLLFFHLKIFHKNHIPEENHQSQFFDFYFESHNHIKEKIISFYLRIYEEDSSKKDKYYLEMYKHLKELRNAIFRKDLFYIFDIRAKIKFYPGKYLRIVQIPLIWSSGDSRTIQNYRIEYSNNFIRLAINEMIKDFESDLNFHNKMEAGSGGGITFENSVINAIIDNKEQVFGKLSFEKKKSFFSNRKDGQFKKHY